MYTYFERKEREVMGVSEKQLRWNKDYQDRCMRIVIQPEKSEGQRIKEAAERAGVSTTQYILQAVRERMESEK